DVRRAARRVHDGLANLGIVRQGMGQAHLLQPPHPRHRKDCAVNFNFKTAISSIAPTLATMLGGPLAGTAVTALESALGLAPGSGADGVTAAVATGMTPETIAAVRAADQKHLEII